MIVLLIWFKKIRDSCYTLSEQSYSLENAQFHSIDTYTYTKYFIVSRVGKILVDM